MTRRNIAIIVAFAAFIVLALMLPGALFAQTADPPLPVPYVARVDVIDTPTQAIVGELEEGGTVWSRPWRGGSSSNRSVIAEIVGTATSVNLRVDNVTAMSTGNDYHDMAEPWTLCGEFEADNDLGYRVWGCPGLLPEGLATLSVTPYDGSRKGTGLTISFTIARGSPPEPEPEPESRPRRYGRGGSGGSGGSGGGSGGPSFVSGGGSGGSSGDGHDIEDDVNREGVICPSNDPNHDHLCGPFRALTVSDQCAQGRARVYLDPITTGNLTPSPPAGAANGASCNAGAVTVTSRQYVCATGSVQTTTRTFSDARAAVHCTDEYIRNNNSFVGCTGNDVRRTSCEWRSITCSGPGC